MKKSSLSKVLSILALSFVFCSSLEAAPGASKVYRVSVTIPAICHTAKSAAQLTEAASMQVALEQDMRENKQVVVKTAVVK